VGVRATILLAFAIYMLCITVGIIRAIGHIIFFITSVQLILSSEALEKLKVFRSGVVADKASVCGNCATFFDEEDIAGYQLSGWDLLLNAIANNGTSHGDISFQTGYDICCLFLLDD
jgi:hypothetical protein